MRADNPRIEAGREAAIYQPLKTLMASWKVLVVATGDAELAWSEAEEVPYIWEVYYRLLQDEEFFHHDLQKEIDGYLRGIARPEVDAPTSRRCGRRLLMPSPWQGRHSTTAWPSNRPCDNGISRSNSHG